MSPLQVKNKKTSSVDIVPCGRCENCLKRKISGWSFRLMQTLKTSYSSNFITLTYDTDHVPISKNGFMVLKKTDMQLFFKRLRISHDRLLSDNKPPPIKYYCVGEYGGKTMRPHYHIILFNSIVELIQPAWQLGQVNYGDVRGVNESSVGYCLKYISKPKKIPMHRNDDRQREFGLMSKGLGETYLTDAMIQWHHNDINNRMYCNVENKKIAMPRYYKQKIYSEDQRVSVGIATRKKMLKDEEKKRAKRKKTYWRDRQEAIIASKARTLKEDRVTTF